MAKSKRFHNIDTLLTKSRLISRDDPEQQQVTADLRSSLKAAFDELAIADFQAATEMRVGLHHLSDDHTDYLFAALVLVLDHQFIEFQRSVEVVPQPQLSPKGKQEDALDVVLDILESIYKQNIKVLVLDDAVEPVDIPVERREDVLSVVIDLVQHVGPSYIWKREDIVPLLALLSIARQLSRDLDKLDLFYALMGTFINRLNLSQEYQLCRDVAETVLRASLADGLAEWGYFCVLQAFNGQRSTNMALLYANACLACLTAKRVASALLVKRLLVALQRFLRDIHFLDREEFLYQYILEMPTLTKFELLDVTNTHVASLIQAADPTAVSELYQYLVNNREFLFGAQKREALPILNTIYSARCAFPTHPDLDSLDPYSSVLELMVGGEDAELMRARALGHSDGLRDIFIGELLRLGEARSVDDLVSDVRNTAAVADRLVKWSFDRQDVDSFLLAMIVKADYSWSFKEHSLPSQQETVEVAIAGDDITTSPFDCYSEYIRRNLSLNDDDELIWLGTSEGRVYQASLSRANLSQVSINDTWQLPPMMQWLQRASQDLALI